MNSNKEVIIWTKGGKGIGLGHIRRCLIIAQELHQKDVKVLFLVNDDPSATEWIKKEGFNYEISSFTEQEFLNTDTANKSLFLIDTKKPIAELIRTLKKKGYKTILMDNITNARLEADIVIFPTPIYDSNLDWSRFNGKLFAGAEYVPVAQSFLEMRNKIKQKTLQPPYQILVTMGGSDPNHLTYKVVSSLIGLTDSNPSPITHYPLLIKVIIGPAFSPDPSLDALEAINDESLEFIRGIDDLSSIMAESHIALTALGTTIFELACMGVPAILIANYKADEADMIAFKRLGIALPLGHHETVSDFDIRQAVENLLKGVILWENMSKRGKILIDGYGAKRIADIVEDCLSAKI